MSNKVPLYTGKYVKDEFTALDVTRQRKAQLRKQKAGYCSKEGCWRRTFHVHVLCANHRLEQLRRIAGEERLFRRNGKYPGGKPDWMCKACQCHSMREKGLYCMHHYFEQRRKKVCR